MYKYGHFLLSEIQQGIFAWVDNFGFVLFVYFIISGDVVAHWQSARLRMQQSRVQIPGIPQNVGQDWWLSPVTLLLGGKNKGWSGAAASTTSMAAGV